MSEQKYTDPHCPACKGTGEIVLQSFGAGPDMRAVCFLCNMDGTAIPRPTDAELEDAGQGRLL